MAEIRSVVIGTGSYLPKRVVENQEFEDTLDTNDQWIRERTGIERRYFAADDELTSDLGTYAAKDALENAGISADQIDAVVLATATPDLTFPATASKVQANLGIKSGFAFDVAAVCAGFIFALANADALIRSGQAKTVLVIGAETFSRILDFDDRGTVVLFGDGAGAVILQAQESECGILATDLNTDGQYHDLLYVDGGVSKNGQVGKLRMHGQEVFRHAVNKLAETTEIAIEKAGLETSDVDWIVPHQANLRIIKATANKMNIPMDRVILTVQDHGNTSAASIPLALDSAVKAGKFANGDIIAMEAIGGGLSWGAAILKWGQ